ncbi:hypothetical protein NON00_12875, partial [Roseomonas sp. GC11]|uniref:hypothetical protein n=1 Tax=Roseomonas sp. GC11 TaxID=2950546 RepID=UPI00210B434D
MRRLAACPGRFLALPMLALVLALMAGGALAQPSQSQPSQFSLPGLGTDANGYAAEIARRAPALPPAGATPKQRAQAESQARAAETRGDWAGA